MQRQPLLVRCPLALARRVQCFHLGLEVNALRHEVHGKFRVGLIRERQLTLDARNVHSR